MIIIWESVILHTSFSYTDLRREIDFLIECDLFFPSKIGAW